MVCKVMISRSRSYLLFAKSNVEGGLFTRAKSGNPVLVRTPILVRRITHVMFGSAFFVRPETTAGITEAQVSLFDTLF